MSGALGLPDPSLTTSRTGANRLKDLVSQQKHCRVLLNQRLGRDAEPDAADADLNEE